MDVISGIFSWLVNVASTLLITLGVVSAPVSLLPETQSIAAATSTTQAETLEEMITVSPTSTAAIPPSKDSPKKGPSHASKELEPEIAPLLEPVKVAEAKKDVSLQAASERARSVLVNIQCQSRYNTIGKSTGSGVLIDPKGIIVTNAHVAQYFLLDEEVADTDCIIRTGSPAAPAYDAELIFLSPQWLGRHALSFSQAWSAVNGDYDYAFLIITKSLTDEPLPTAFPYVTLATDQVSVGEQVVIAGYAAEFLSEDLIDHTLYPTVVYGSVKSVQSFAGSNADVLQLGGSAAAQAGSSGGAILGADGTLRGMLTLGSRQESTEERTFAGISADYIRRTYEKEEGKLLSSLLEMDARSAVNAFKWRIPDLARPLIKNLNNPNFYFFCGTPEQPCPPDAIII